MPEFVHICSGCDSGWKGPKCACTARAPRTGFQAYQDTIDVSTSITKPQEEAIEKGEINSQWWISVITGLIIIQAIAFLMMFYRKKRSIV
jgi:hypothetical protein